MTRKSMQLGDVQSVVNKRKRVKAKRRPAKVTTWRGWGVLEPADSRATCCAECRRAFLATYVEELAREHADNGHGKLVRVVAKLREVKP
jgi:hypothetical protein